MGLGLIAGLTKALGSKALNGVLGIGNAIGGLFQGRRQAKQQEKLQNQQMEYGREMWEKQNKAENERMALQNQWNMEAAEKTQEYAKEMFDYTGYENQVRQMKAAGLNPALMNGGSASGGQASGATVEPAQVMQPMGLQVALQAEQTQAQTALINAQAEKTRQESKRQAIDSIITSSADLVNKINDSKLKEKQKEVAEKSIKQIEATISQIKENTEVLRNNKELLEFQNDINKMIKSSTYWDKDKEVDWEQSVIAKYYGELKKDIATWEKEEQQMLFDKEIVKRLWKDIERITQGKVDELSIGTPQFSKLSVEMERENWDFKQEKALSDIIDQLGGDGKYARLLVKIIKYFLEK